MTQQSSLATTLIAASLLAVGCADTHRVEVMTVLSNANCQTNQIGVHLIDYATLASFRGTQLIGMTESPEAAQNPARLVAIVPGQFPTPGYNVVLRGDTTLSAGVLTVAVDIERPPAGATLAQMITHPCLVVGIADPLVDSVRVVNDADEVLGQIDLTSTR